jgi:hypothetical protein
MRLSGRITAIFGDAHVNVRINRIGFYGSNRNSLVTVQEYKGIQQCITSTTEQHCSRIQEWFLPFNDSEIAKLELGFPTIYTLITLRSTKAIHVAVWSVFLLEKLTVPLGSNCVLLGYFAARSGNFLPTFRDRSSSRVKNPKKKKSEITHNSTLACQ